MFKILRAFSATDKSHGVIAETGRMGVVLAGH
jgi:hypothetical protein